MTGDSDRWVSYIQAAELIGCHEETVVRLVRAGEITQRQVRRSLPSLHLESVEAFAKRWQEREAQRARLREERERRLLERPATLAEPPELGADDVWLDSATVALVLRLSMTRVSVAMKKYPLVAR
ncbi:MAG: hypothetical protein ABIR82_08015 [Nocardioides sp.]